MLNVLEFEYSIMWFILEEKKGTWVRQYRQQKRGQHYEGQQTFPQGKGVEYNVGNSCRDVHYNTCTQPNHKHARTINLGVDWQIGNNLIRRKKLVRGVLAIWLSVFIMFCVWAQLLHLTAKRTSPHSVPEILSSNNWEMSDISTCKHSIRERNNSKTFLSVRFLMG